MPYNAPQLMKYLDFTFPTPEENLACDEALLDGCEDGRLCEILRFWEPQNYFIVAGYSNKARLEANLEACRNAGIPFLRRISGGGTVLQGPGCLNFSLILEIANSPFLQTISQSNAFIMTNHKSALQPWMAAPVEVQGITDLAIDARKFSGNAQRRKKSYLLFHGTFLLNFDFAFMEKFLPLPSKQPDYRQNRPHSDFLTNLPLPAKKIKETLRKFWKAAETLKEEKIPLSLIRKLTARYSDPAWNFKF